MADFEQAVALVLQQEGGYVNNPADAGGETKYGITKRDHPTLDIASLTVDQAKTVYRQDYWLFQDVQSQAVANKLLSMAVLYGKGTAVRLLQASLRVPVDGVFGPATLTAVNRTDGQRLLDELKAQAAYRAHRVAVKDSTQEIFVLGWIRRAVSG